MTNSYRLFLRMTNCLPRAVGLGQVETGKAQPCHDGKLEAFQVSFLELLGVRANKTDSFYLFFIIWGKQCTFPFPKF